MKIIELKQLFRGKFLIYRPKLKADIVNRYEIDPTHMIHPEDLGEYNWYVKRFEGIEDHFLAEKVMKNSIALRRGQKSLILDAIENKAEPEPEEVISERDKEIGSFLNFFSKKVKENERLKKRN